MKKEITCKLFLGLALFVVAFSFNTVRAANADNVSNLPEGTTIDTSSANPTKPETTKPATTPAAKTVSGTGSNVTVKLDNPIKANNIQDLLFSIVDIAIFIGAIVAVFVFIWIGFKLVMAQGNESALKEAKDYFVAAVIGTAILIGAKVIVVVIKNTLVSTGVVDQSVFTLPK